MSTAFDFVKFPIVLVAFSVSEGIRHEIWHLQLSLRKPRKTADDKNIRGVSAPCHKRVAAQCRYRREAGAEMHKCKRCRLILNNVSVQPQTRTMTPFYTKSSSRSVAALTTDWYQECLPSHFSNIN